MVWVNRIILGLILILVASPALAAIDRFTDNKGVLHITNSNAEKARLDERDEDSTSPAKLGPASPAPVVKPSQETEPSEPEDKEPTKPSSYLTVRKGVIHISNVTNRQVEVARAQPATSRPAEPAPGGSHVAPEHPVAPVIPAAFASVTSAPVMPPPAPQQAGTPVSSYRDRQGVIHITNAPSRDHNRNTIVAGWSSQLPISQIASGDALASGGRETGTFLVRKAEARALPISPVAFAEPEPVGAFPVAALPLRANAPEPKAKGAVRRFRDAKGVVHIVGRGPAPGQPYQAPLTPTGRMIAGASLPSFLAGGMHRTYPGRGLTGPPTPGLPEPTVLVRKNSQGKVLIRNAPPAEILRSAKEEVRRRLEPVLAEAAYLFGLPVSLIEAVVKVESNFQTAAVSPKGAMGLMQLMPGTAKFLNVEDPFCPRENILGGCRYLRLLLDFFGQSLPLALAAYNAGFQRVIDAGFQVPDIQETQNFVTKVMGHYYLREKQRYFARRYTL